MGGESVLTHVEVTGSGGSRASAPLKELLLSTAAARATLAIVRGFTIMESWVLARTKGAAALA